MRLDEFDTRLIQMKRGPIPQRPIFIWTGAQSRLEELLQDLEIHRADIVNSSSPKNNTLSDHAKIIQNYLATICQDYQKVRREPSALIIQNSVLLARYSCDLSILFRNAVNPRSAVVLVFPEESRREFPSRTDNWVRKDTASIVKQVAKQLGDINCIVDLLGGGD
jgi:hypothetical protein